MQTAVDQCAAIVDELLDNSVAIHVTLSEYKSAVSRLSEPKRLDESHDRVLCKVVELMKCPVFAAKFAADAELVKSTVSLAWSYRGMSVLAVLSHHRPEVYRTAFELGVSKLMVPAHSRNSTINTMFRSWLHALACNLLAAHATRSALRRPAGRPDMRFAELTRVLDDDALLRVYLAMSDMKWDFGGDPCLLGDLINDRAHLLTKDTLTWVYLLYEVYRRKVEDPLKVAASKDKKLDAKALEAIAVECRLSGDAQSVLKGLVPHLRSATSRVEYLHRKSGMRNRTSEKKHMHLMHRLRSGIRALCDPDDVLRNRLTHASKQHNRTRSAPCKSYVQEKRGKCDDSTPLYSFLKERIVPRSGCEKCEVARGADASVRRMFSREGGYGPVRDVSTKRACTHLDHAITWRQDIEPLVEEFEAKKKQKVTYRKKKALDFMQNCYGVEPVGSAPHHVVTLYEEGNGRGAKSVHFAFVGFQVA